MPSCGKRSVLSQIPLVLSGTAMVFALSRSCLIASTVLTSGFEVPARTATPRGTRARSTSVPAIIRFAAMSSLRPSLERIATSAETPRASCAAIVCGPAPWDAPDPVVTLMPLVRSNSGTSCSYAPLNPPDIRTFTAPLHIPVGLPIQYAHWRPLQSYRLNSFVCKQPTHKPEKAKFSQPYVLIVSQTAKPHMDSLSRGERMSTYGVLRLFARPGRQIPRTRCTERGFLWQKGILRIGRHMRRSRQ